MSKALKFATNNVRGITTIGVAKFPKIIKPDPNYGGYKVDLLFDENDPAALAFKATIEKFHEEGRVECRQLLGLKPAKTGKNGTLIPEEALKMTELPVRPDLDKDREPTGKIFFRFKSGESIKQKDGTTKPTRPRVFDAAGKPWDMTKDIGGGSTLRVRYTMHRFYQPATGYGVKMYLDEVQVVKLRVFEQGFDAVPETEVGDDSDARGFGAVDGADAGTSTGSEPETATGSDAAPAAAKDF